MASVCLADWKRLIVGCIPALIMPILFGCAPAMTSPVTIRHDSTPSMQDMAASRGVDYKEPVGETASQSGTAIQDGVISEVKSSDQIAPAGPDPVGEKSQEGQSADNTTARKRKKPYSDQRVTALLDLLKSKKIISDEEAGLLAGQSSPVTVSSNADTVSAVSDKYQAGKTTAATPQIYEKDQDIALAYDDAKIEEIDKRVTYTEQRLSEMLYGGKTADLASSAVPEWVKRIRIGGDIRLRYEHDFFDKNNPITVSASNPFQLVNYRTDEDRFKYRLRLGAEAKVTDELTVGLSLATGSTSNPVSTNTVFGDFMNKDNILIDQAYFKLKLKTPGELPTVFTVTGGRMPNPWFSTDLVWDNDLNFEGLAVDVRKPVDDIWTPFLTLGVFPLQQSDPVSVFDFSQHSKWLFGGQLGVERKYPRGLSAKVGAAFYYFDNITGVKNNDPSRPGITNWSTPLYQQKGNTIFDVSADQSGKMAYASGFKELNLTGQLDVGYWDPVHVVIAGDFVKNLGFNQSKVNALVGDVDPYTAGFQAPSKETVGYQIGLSVGHPAVREFGQWRTYVNYKYLEADAVVDAFTDSDFHLGGTNAKGWILGTEFGLMKNTWLSLRWMTANEISNRPLAVDVLHVDFNAKF